MPNTSPEQRNRNRPSLPPIPGLLIGVLAASTASIFIRFAQAEAPSMAIAAFRLGFATLILAPFVLTRYRHQLRSLTRRNLALALISGSFLALHFATWITSLEFTSVASSVVLVQTSPLFVAVAAPIFLKETVGRNLTAGLALSFLGSIIVAISDACTWSAGLQCPPVEVFIGGEAIQGDILALIGALGAAGYLLIGRRLRSEMELMPYIFMVYAAAAVWLLAVALLTGVRLVGYSSATLLWFLLLAILPQLVAHSTVNWALRYLPAALVSVTLLGEPVASTVWAFLLLEETPPPIRLIGAALILVGIAVAASSNSSE